MTNPFDPPDGDYLVLFNALGEYSLWPDGLAVPAGWTVAHGPAGHHRCLEYVKTHWTDSAAVHPDQEARPV
jgi:MbtH protein